jgi:ketosteroid isomerase-like protein
LELRELAELLREYAAGVTPRATLSELLRPVLADDPLDVGASDPAPWDRAPDEARLFWRLVYLIESGEADSPEFRDRVRRVVATLDSTRSAAATHELLPIVVDARRLCEIVEKHQAGIASRTSFLSVVADVAIRWMSLGVLSSGACRQSTPCTSRRYRLPPPSIVSWPGCSRMRGFAALHVRPQPSIERRYVRIALPCRWDRRVAALVAIAVVACAGGGQATRRSAVSTAAASESTEAQAIRAARTAQNRAIAALDTAAVARYWTEDVEIRRGLGALVTGREAYKQLFNPDPGAVARGEELIYQREPASIEVSAQWPLAYEAGTWVGHLGRADGPAVIGGRYGAQWVKRNGRWLIRGEVYVALTCAGPGCSSVAAP